MNRIAMFLAGAVLLAGSAAAQDTTAQDHARTFTFTQGEPMKMMPDSNMMFQRQKMADGNIAFVGAEMAGTGEVVTGVPYTATAVTESTQTLADGNKIVNKTSSFVARDSQGRTRREDSIGRIGSLQTNDHKMVFIMDPTSHSQYVSETGGDTTKVIREDGSGKSEPKIIELHSERKMIKRITVDGHADQDSSDAQVKHENLGTQTIAGVSAEGKRDTTTIPAGQIGNDRAIEIVSESWYSPELHATVMRKQSDPRVGETVYKLTDIQRVEPDPALFQPPAGTRVMKTQPIIELKEK